MTIRAAVPEEIDDLDLVAALHRLLRDQAVIGVEPWLLRRRGQRDGHAREAAQDKPDHDVSAR